MHEISLDFETRRGRLRFYLLPKLRIAMRYLLAMMALLLGASLTLRLSPLVGIPLWLAGLALAVARGSRNIKLGGDRKSSPRWVMSAPKELRKIRRKLDQTRALPKNPLNGFSLPGIVSLVLMALAFSGGNLFVIPDGLWLEHIWSILFMQASLLLVLFFSTLAEPWEPDLVKKKLELMEHVRDRVQRRWAAVDPLVNPMLQLDRMGEEHPTPNDLKLFIRFDKAPESFLGIQVQMTFNKGPNGEVPYLYCVLLAKSDFRPMSLYRPASGRQDTLEKGRDDDIDFLVVRQTANNSGGYKTGKGDVDRLLDRAMEIALQMLGRSPG